MEALDEHGLQAYECTADGGPMEDAGGGVLACRTCGHRTDEPGTGTLADAFDVRHRQWGLRGDPHVWSALRDETAATPTPYDHDGVRSELVDALRRVARVDLADDALPDDPVPREEFAHGGMSSGMVDVGWWRTKGLPLLVARAKARRPRPPEPAAEVAPPREESEVPAPRQESLGMRVLVWLMILLIPTLFIGGGAYLLFQRFAGTEVQATVLACETTGNWSRYYNTTREECVAEWTIDGRTETGGFQAGNGSWDVGETVDATVRNGTAYSRSLVLPLIMLGVGLPFLWPVVSGVRRGLGGRDHGAPATVP